MLKSFTPKKSRVAIFALIFMFIFALILRFKIINSNYISFLIGLKISYKLVLKLTLLNKK